MLVRLVDRVGYRDAAPDRAPSAAGPAADVATGVWRHQVRFIGAGSIGISAIWSLGRLARPGRTRRALVARRRRAALSQAAGGLPRVERDIPIGTSRSSVAAVPRSAGRAVRRRFLSGTARSQVTSIPLVDRRDRVRRDRGLHRRRRLRLYGRPHRFVEQPRLRPRDSDRARRVARARGARRAARTGVAPGARGLRAVRDRRVLCVATIANDNLQDLKTGQLVDATPWRQQVALIIGVVFGALVIPPILDLLQPRVRIRRRAAAAAPAGAQALPRRRPRLDLDARARRHLRARFLGPPRIGVLAGIAIIAIDEFLRITRGLRATAAGRRHRHLLCPPASLPMVVVGAVPATTTTAGRRPTPDPRRPRNASACCSRRASSSARASGASCCRRSS
jgi:hypothetical protein